jgi:hypothetical protein
LTLVDSYGDEQKEEGWEGPPSGGLMFSFFEEIRWLDFWKWKQEFLMPEITPGLFK